MKRPLVTAAMAGMAALLVASALPHQHPDGSAAAHSSSACQLCRIQQQAGATPAAGATASVDAPAVASIAHADAAPRAVWFLHASAPRSPPVTS